MTGGKRPAAFCFSGDLHMRIVDKLIGPLRMRQAAPDSALASRRSVTMCALY